LLFLFSRHPEGNRDCVYVHTYRTSRLFIPGRGRLTHGHERSPLVALIADNACAPRVEDGLAVHQKTILMMAMGE
jgi:hypothetical protein